MNVDSLQSNWAAWLALAAILVAAVAIAPRLLGKTSRSKLNRVVADMKKTHRELRKSARRVRRAERKIDRLRARADRVKPRIMQEAKEAVEDAQALQKILFDKVMVAENHVRRVIHDEFPPAEHDRLRRKYLPQDVKDKRPFSF